MDRLFRSHTIDLQPVESRIETPVGSKTEYVYSMEVPPRIVYYLLSWLVSMR